MNPEDSECYLIRFLYFPVLFFLFLFRSGLLRIRPGTYCRYFTTNSVNDVTISSELRAGRTKTALFPYSCGIPAAEQAAAEDAARIHAVINVCDIDIATGYIVI